MAHTVERKIKSQKDIIAIAKRLKKKGKKTVVIHGCFDIVHRGHMNALSKAKKQGDVLIVLMNNDKSTREYKGNSRPIIGEKDRALLLSALEWVDYVVLFGRLSPLSIAKKIKPDVYCNGLDFERKIMKRYSGRFHIIKRTRDVSTTDIIKKILQL